MQIIHRNKPVGAHVFAQQQFACMELKKLGLFCAALCLPDNAFYLISLAKYRIVLFSDFIICVNEAKTLEEFII